jgi:hypothetical protein
LVSNEETTVNVSSNKSVALTIKIYDADGNVQHTNQFTLALKINEIKYAYFA